MREGGEEGPTSTSMALGELNSSGSSPTSVTSTELRVASGFSRDSLSLLRPPERILAARTSLPLASASLMEDTREAVGTGEEGDGEERG